MCEPSSIMDRTVKRKIYPSFSSTITHHVSRQPWVVLAGDAGHRTPFDVFPVGVRPTDHRCLSAPVRLGLSIFVATISFSYANHPFHR